MLYLVTGLPGCGKSTVANYLKQKLDCPLINTDSIHSMLFSERTETGDFTPEQLAEIYRNLKTISHYLASVEPEVDFIIEGSFRFKEQRDFVINEMIKLRFPYKLIFCAISNEEIIKQRIEKRFLEGAPDTFEDYLKIKSVYEYPKDAIEIDNSGDVKELYEQIDQKIITK